MTPDTEPAGSAVPSRKKPRIALAFATSMGIGYLPKAPGTFGSIVGCIVASLSVLFWNEFVRHVAPQIFRKQFADQVAGWGVLRPDYAPESHYWVALIPSVLVFMVVAAVGVWSSASAASFAGIQDPQYVVIDEVSGQHLTFLLGLLPAYMHQNPAIDGADSLFSWRMFDARHLIVGFILFRLFDIWKPFPIRHLEKLPGGWGIMADDWLAGIYAAILLRLALHLNLL